MLLSLPPEEIHQMLFRIGLVVIAWLACVVPASAQWSTIEAPVIKGAPGLIIVPDNWNGSLFIYAHGYTADDRFVQPLPDDVTPGNFTSKLPQLLQASVLPAFSGYAIATTTFRSSGWYVKDAVKDIENLRRYFVKHYGKPKFAYMWGHSGGGMVTAAVIEYTPNRYDGALPLCGPVAGARRNFNGAFDLRSLYEYVCGDLPAARFTCRVCSGGARCLADGDCPTGETCGAAETPAPPEDGLTAECTDFLLDHPDTFSENPTSPGGGFVDGPATVCFGDLSGRTPPTPEQAARKDLFLRASRIPERFIATDLFFASIGMAEVVHRRTNGRHPWGNAGVDYASPLLTPVEQAAVNAGVRRVASDKLAVEYMRRWYEPRAHTNSKVLTVQALDDGLVIPENEDKYRQAFLAAGRSDQLVQLQTSVGGHCGFIGELFPALDGITAWVERGEKPSYASVHAACPGCSFTPDAPGPYGLKVAERAQRGTPPQTLVCDGAPGDCPPGDVCDLDQYRCARP